MEEGKARWYLGGDVSVYDLGGGGRVVSGQGMMLRGYVWGGPAEHTKYNLTVKGED